ncbi:MAG: hypothetical protein EHM32_01625, partial [Spirochaetales bacterium]
HMNKTVFAAVFFILAFSIGAISARSQTIEIIDGIRTVHNAKEGVRGGKLGLSIQLIRKIGDVDATDDNFAFYFPSDVALDASGNIHILDSGNHRIQKFASEGKYLATMGRRGQGPGEFNNPDSLDYDARGFLFIWDKYQSRFHTLKPNRPADDFVKFHRPYLQKLRFLKSGSLAFSSTNFVFADKADPPRLIEIFDEDGDQAGSFGEAVDYGDVYQTIYGNVFDYTTDANDCFYLASIYHNKLEKYRVDGKLQWRADWPIDFSSAAWGAKFSRLDMNACSAGVAVDAKGRIWVVTLTRKLQKDEKVERSTKLAGNPGGDPSIITKTAKGNTDLRTTDAYKLLIFDTNGVLLGGIPLTHFADGIRIFDDHLFLLDQLREATYYQYKIIEK